MSMLNLRQVYTLERLAAGDLEGAGPLLGALAAALGRLHKGTPEWAPFAATLARRLAVRSLADVQLRT